MLHIHVHVHVHVPLPFSIHLNACGQSKVPQLDVQVVVEEEVAKLQVPVDDLAPADSGERSWQALA